MWKTITLCASLFGAAALALATLARRIDPAALPALAGIGLCLIGVVLILAAPPRKAEPLALVHSGELPAGDDTDRATDKMPSLP